MTGYTTSLIQQRAWPSEPLNTELIRRNGVQKPSYLRELTLRCRTMLEMATERETIDQLRLWVTELAAQVDAVGAGRGRDTNRRDGRSRPQAS
jgi:hypothetical protein